MKANRLPQIGATFVAWTALACAGDVPDAPPAASTGTPAETLAGWLAPDAALPARTEVVAVADAVAVLAAKEPAPEEQAKLYRLAGDARLRLFRAERALADGHEASELLSAVARVARGKESGCEAEAARARLLGEIARDAATTYRELYLAKRRNAALAEGGRESACVAGLDRDLAFLGAYRPSGGDLTALEREGDRAAAAHALASAAASGAASAGPSASAGAAADVVVAPDALVPSKTPVKISKIDRYASEGGGRVVVHVSGPTSFHVGALAGGAGQDPRIYVDIDRASSKGIKREDEVGGAIKRLRSAPREDGTRIVLDLAADLHRKVFYLPEPFRIVIDVSNRAPDEPKKAGASSLRRVAIDPGHGGTDAGAIGPTGLKEKDITLDIAHRVAPVLASELNLETLLTRDSDVFVPLDERTARANAFHADLFVSIHCNASETGEARGIEVFVLDEHKDAARATARIAALENGLSSAKSLDPAALDAEMASIATRLGSGDIQSSSRRLGLLLGKATLASLRERYPDTSDHGLKSAGFYVLVGAEMPAVLFETSFISNPDDEARLAKADYRQKLADGVVNAIRAYRDGK